MGQKEDANLYTWRLFMYGCVIYYIQLKRAWRTKRDWMSRINSLTVLGTARKAEPKQAA